MTRAAFLIGFGGPSSKDEIRPFLDKVLAGRPVPPERYEEVVRQYEAVGGASPYNRLAFELAGKLELRLMKDGRAMPVYVGMRNANPPLTEALQRMAADGVTEAAGLILSSYRSEPSWGRYVDAVEKARAEAPRAPEVRFLTPWNEDVLFIRSMADRVREGEKAIPQEDRADAHWLFTAHSIPVAADHASRYAEQVNRCAARVAAMLGHANWSLCFQSRSGRPEEPWLEPDVVDAVSSLSPSRSLHALVIPAGFLLDHVEVLFDLDVKAARAAKSAGITYHRAPTVGDHPDFLELLSLRTAHALKLPAAKGAA